MVFVWVTEWHHAIMLMLACSSDLTSEPVPRNGF